MSPFYYFIFFLFYFFFFKLRSRFYLFIHSQKDDYHRDVECSPFCFHRAFHETRSRFKDGQTETNREENAIFLLI